MNTTTSIHDPENSFFSVIRGSRILLRREPKPMTNSFDPDGAALEGTGVFGLPEAPESARVHILPVPFDATTSYRKGAGDGPEAILAASRQVELFDPSFGRPWKHGLHWIEADARVYTWNEDASEAADPILAAGGAIAGDAKLEKKLARVNAIGAELNAYVEGEVARLLDAERFPVVVGGDHCVPFGAIAACARKHGKIGLLHFDAHADLREAYEGFTWSHASIMFNVVKLVPGVTKLVQVGIRDFGEREHELIRNSEGRIHTLFDTDWQRAKQEGGNLRELARKTLAELPQKLYLSFDIDGLEPALCPNTGTPVPGGLSWPEALLWLEELSKSGKQVVGLDLNEVNPGEPDFRGDNEDSWDAIVGARLLYRLIGAALPSR